MLTSRLRTMVGGGQRFFGSHGPITLKRQKKELERRTEMYPHDPFLKVGVREKDETGGASAGFKGRRGGSMSDPMRGVPLSDFENEAYVESLQKRFDAVEVLSSFQDKMFTHKKPTKHAANTLSKSAVGGKSFYDSREVGSDDETVVCHERNEEVSRLYQLFEENLEFRHEVLKLSPRPFEYIRQHVNKLLTYLSTHNLVWNNPSQFQEDVANAMPFSNSNIAHIPHVSRQIPHIPKKLDLGDFFEDAAVHRNRVGGKKKKLVPRSGGESIEALDEAWDPVEPQQNSMEETTNPKGRAAIEEAGWRAEGAGQEALHIPEEQYLLGNYNNHNGALPSEGPYERAGDLRISDGFPTSAEIGAENHYEDLDEFEMLKANLAKEDENEFTQIAQSHAGLQDIVESPFASRSEHVSDKTNKLASQTSPTSPSESASLSSATDFQHAEKQESITNIESSNQSEKTPKEKGVDYSMETYDRGWGGKESKYCKETYYIQEMKEFIRNSALKDMCLKNVWRYLGGEFVLYNDSLVPSVFGEGPYNGTLKPYWQTRKNACIFDLSFKKVLSITGRDRLLFSNHFLSVQVNNPVPKDVHVNVFDWSLKSSKDGSSSNESYVGKIGKEWRETVKKENNDVCMDTYGMECGDVQYGVVLDSKGLLLDDCHIYKTPKSILIQLSGYNFKSVYSYLQQYSTHCRSTGLDVFIREAKYKNTLAFQGPQALSKLSSFLSFAASEGEAHTFLADENVPAEESSVSKDCPFETSMKSLCVELFDPSGDRVTFQNWGNTEVRFGKSSQISANAPYGGVGKISMGEPEIASDQSNNSPASTSFEQYLRNMPYMRWFGISIRYSIYRCRARPCAEAAAPSQQSNLPSLLPRTEKSSNTSDYLLECIASRTGMTGEDGFEFMFAPAQEVTPISNPSESAPSERGAPPRESSGFFGEAGIETLPTNASRSGQHLSDHNIEGISERHPTCKLNIENGEQSSSNSEELLQNQSRENVGLVPKSNDLGMILFMTGLLSRNSCVGGVYTLDYLRAECGYIRFGVDVNDNSSISKASLNWLVSQYKLKYNLMLGAKSIQTQLCRKAKHVRVGIISDGFILGKSQILSNPHRRPIGIITSVTYSPILKCRIAQGYVKNEFARHNQHILISVLSTLDTTWTKKKIKKILASNTNRHIVHGRVIQLPLLNHNYAKSRRQDIRSRTKVFSPFQRNSLPRHSNEPTNVYQSYRTNTALYSPFRKPSVTRLLPPAKTSRFSPRKFTLSQVPLGVKKPSIIPAPDDLIHINSSL